MKTKAGMSSQNHRVCRSVRLLFKLEVVQTGISGTRIYPLLFILISVIMGTEKENISKSKKAEYAAVMCSLKVSFGISTGQLPHKATSFV